MADLQYPVIETFTSIQGEGTRVGRVANFVRLAGCNLACRWCDTEYAWKPGVMTRPTPRAAAEIAAEAPAGADIVITGGEPLLHNLCPLVGAFAGRHVTVETNGTIPPSCVCVSLWSVSPKVGSSGHTPRPDVLEGLLKKSPSLIQFKFVVGGPGDLAEALALLASLPLVAVQGVPVILQPVGSPGDSREASLGALEALAGMVVGSPDWAPYQVRVLPQLHRLLWGERRGA